MTKAPSKRDILQISFDDILPMGCIWQISLERRTKQITIYHSDGLLQTYQAVLLKASDDPFKVMGSVQYSI